VALATSLLLVFILHGRDVTPARAAAPPSVNGLFFGDGDNNDYVFYDESANGSDLYIYFDSPTLYVALVVDRSVNDNAFAMKGWQGNDYVKDPAVGFAGHRALDRLHGSEFASFTLTCTAAALQWSFQHGYAQPVTGTPDGTGDWESGNISSGGGVGTYPPAYTAGSSLAWNLTNYNNRAVKLWDIDHPNSGGGIADWISPFSLANTNGSGNLIPVGLDGYPAAGALGYSTAFEYEWSMVYEWSTDLTSCGTSPVVVTSGQSHHSPGKNGITNDTFDTPPSDPLFDFGDLPDTYSTTLSTDGARHQIVVNTPYLGSSPDIEMDGQPNALAQGDDNAGANDEDGVTHAAGPWTNNTNQQINLDIQGFGSTADVGIWIDWDGDGRFQSDEFYPFLDLPVGGISTVNVLVPGAADYTSGTALKVRVRIFADEADAPGGSLDWAASAGAGANGEVEDELWDLSGPTAITLTDLRAARGSGLAVPIAAIGLALWLLLAFTRRRSQAR
jgi:hypothetical protein